MRLIKKVVLLWTLLFAAPAIAAPSNFLVSTDWLEKNLNNPKLRIIEVSVDTGGKMLNCLMVVERNGKQKRDL